MSEAIIAKRFQSKDYTYYPPYDIPNDTIITSNSTYNVPLTGYYNVQCLGGGGAGGYPSPIQLDQSRYELPYGTIVDPPPGFMASPIIDVIAIQEEPPCYTGGGGGGSGYISASTVFLNKGQLVPITIGRGGIGVTSQGIGNSGGTTSFGTYVFASGGRGGQTYTYPLGENIPTSYYTLDYKRWAEQAPYNWLGSAYYRLMYGPLGGGGANSGTRGSVYYDYAGLLVMGQGSRAVARGGTVYLDGNNTMVSWSSSGNQSNYGQGGNGGRPNAHRYEPWYENGTSGMVIIKFSHLSE